MTGVAAGGDAIEGCGELARIAGLDGEVDGAERLLQGGVDQLGDR